MLVEQGVACAVVHTTFCSYQYLKMINFMVCAIYLNRDAKTKTCPHVFYILWQCPLTFLESDMKPAYFIFDVTGETEQGVGREKERQVCLAFSL